MDDTDGGGRKKRSGSDTRKRGGIIGFRATDAERAELAAKAGLTLGSYIRAAALTRPATRATRRARGHHTICTKLHVKARHVLITSLSMGFQMPLAFELDSERGF